MESSGSNQPEWHYIGHLQRNKVKYIVPYAKLIHSVDSLKLAKEIAKHAKDNGIIQDILLQVNTSGEESKFGCDPGEIFQLCSDVKEIDDLNVLGLMTIGSFTGNETIIRSEFNLLRSIRDELSDKLTGVDLRYLSMGMTGDYPIAIEEGATHVRIGTAIFGERDYSNR
jgi:pyridoxal phosphate enzyme (YggS family)